MLDGACNAIGNFITNNFTLPHILRFRGNSISTISTFRPVHSDVCQWLYHILTIGIL